MNKAIFLAVVMLGASVVALAEGYYTHIYDRVDGGWKRVGSFRNDDNQDYVLLCDNPNGCHRFPCFRCHGRPMDQQLYAGDQATKHQRIHFPKAGLRLAEGHLAALGTLSVTRMNGLLVVQDPQGRRFQLPPDAYVVKGRDGRPLFITYKGGQAPQLMR